jgi:hypothetical protein
MSLSFTQHPASVGETYLQHLAFACMFRLPACSAVACLPAELHAASMDFCRFCSPRPAAASSLTFMHC